MRNLLKVSANVLSGIRKLGDNDLLDGHNDFGKSLHNASQAESDGVGDH